MKFITMQLLNVLNTSLTKDADYIIAQFMLNHLSNIDKMTIYDIAEKCYVSTATISRFVRHLGYKNYNELKDNFIWTNQLKHAFYYIPQIDNREDHLSKVITSLEELSINDKQLNDINEMIYTAQKISVIGMSMSQMIALQLQQFLFILGKQAYACIQPTQQLENIHSLKENDVIILISTRGNYYQNIINELMEAKQRKIKIIMLTFTPSLSYTDFIDEILICGNEKYYEYSYYNMFLMVDYIIASYSNYLQTKKCT